jgi:hypothetical protein
MRSQSVADVLGPWIDSDFDSGLIERLRRAWSIPIPELPNQMLATFLRQELAMEVILPEAKKRLEAGIDDDSELYEGELAAAYREATERQSRRST